MYEYVQFYFSADYDILNDQQTAEYMENPQVVQCAMQKKFINRHFLSPIGFRILSSSTVSCSSFKLVSILLKFDCMAIICCLLQDIKFEPLEE